MCMYGYYNCDTSNFFHLVLNCSQIGSQAMCLCDGEMRERAPRPGPAKHSVMLLPRWIGVSIGSRAHLESYANQVAAAKVQ